MPRLSVLHTSVPVGGAAISLWVGAELIVVGIFATVACIMVALIWWQHRRIRADTIPQGREFKRAAEYVAYRRGIWLLVVSGEIDARRLGRLPAMVQSNSAKRTAADCCRVDKAHSSPIWWPSQRGATGAAPARYSSNAPQVQIQFTCRRCWFSSTRRCSASRRATDRRRMNLMVARTSRSSSMLRLLDQSQLLFQVEAPARPRTREAPARPGTRDHFDPLDSHLHIHRDRHQSSGSQRRTSTIFPASQDHHKAAAARRFTLGRRMTGALETSKSDFRW